MQKRNLFLVLTLAIITFGVYTVFWLYSTKKEIHTRSGNIRIPSLWLLFAPILLFLGTFLLYAAANFAGITSAGSAASSIINILIFIAGIAGVIGLLVVPLFWHYRYARALTAASGGIVSTGFIFSMFIVLAIFVIYPIWLLIVQHELNRLADTQPTAQPTPSNTPQLNTTAP